MNYNEYYQNININSTPNKENSKELKVKFFI